MNSFRVITNWFVLNKKQCNLGANCFTRLNKESKNVDAIYSGHWIGGSVVETADNFLRYYNCKWTSPWYAEMIRQTGKTHRHTQTKTYTRCFGPKSKILHDRKVHKTNAVNRNVNCLHMQKKNVTEWSVSHYCSFPPVEFNLLNLYIFHC